MYNCALCSVHVCSNGELNKAPKNCPCINEKMGVIKELYKQEDIYKIAHASSLITSQGYCKNTRLEEIMDFANECGYKNIGLAFCIGLVNESKMLSKVLSHNGFEVNSVICKNGHISKEYIDVIEPEKVAMCNPIGQAMFLNEAKTDLNILLGLCVGHDSLFIKYSEAPVTVFAVKDRVLGHNPLAVIYQAEAYYKDKLFKR
ncbi:MAG: metal-binding protein [Firmicutes bacterium]|nr:metal-binding protein [Bacillota bacterium]